MVEAVQRLGIKLGSGARYMDDIRLWLHAIRLGWRLVEGCLTFKTAWRDEERAAGMTPLGKTTEILHQVMNNLCDWLVLTMENEEMFGGVLPTLDLEIWVNEVNMVLYQYYEKSMTPNMVLHKRVPCRRVPGGRPSTRNLLGG